MKADFEPRIHDLSFAGDAIILLSSCGGSSSSPEELKEADK
jgi:hypothetical protein